MGGFGIVAEMPFLGMLNIYVGIGFQIVGALAFLIAKSEDFEVLIVWFTGVSFQIMGVGSMGHLPIIKIAIAPALLSAIIFQALVLLFASRENSKPRRYFLTIALLWIPVTELLFIIFGQ